MGWKLKGRQREEKKTRGVQGYVPRPQKEVSYIDIRTLSFHAGLPTTLVSHFEFSFSLSPLLFDSCSSFFRLLKAERS